MNDELNIVIDAIDRALLSDNPSVKTALRNLLMLTSLTMSEDIEGVTGPLRRIINQQIQLSQRVTEIERAIASPKSYGSAGMSGGYDPFTAPSTSAYPKYYSETALDTWRKLNGL